MIKKLPAIYPKETAYSWLARAYAQSGIVFHKCFASEVFGSRNEMLDFNFINVFNNEFKKIVEGSIGFKELLLNHTLFKYYARYLEADKRIEAYKIGTENKGLLTKKLFFPVNRRNYFLRYCPECVEEDREQYGECYFHIEHQIYEVRVCPIHGSTLINTTIQNSKCKDSTFITLEQLNPSTAEMGAAQTKTNINWAVAKYIYDVFSENLALKNDVMISDYLSAKLGKAYFVDVACTKKNITRLTTDMNGFFQGLEVGAMKEYKVCDIYRGVNTNPYDYYLAGIFQGITPKELANPKLSKSEIRKPIIRRVIELWKAGSGISDISVKVSRTEAQVRGIVGGYQKICKTLKKDSPK